MNTIKIENYSKNIGKNRVLSDINLILESGIVYGLKGKNGSGKTMLMRAISGLISPTEGKVIINEKVLGKDISFPESIGILIENPSFLPQYSGFDNLKMIASIKNCVDDEKIKMYMRELGLDPDDTKKYRKYSLGMKQKLGIVCAIMENPDIVILDEPINALDEESVERVKKVITRIKTEDKIIIIACHDKEELFYLADKIIEIEGGKIKREYLVDNNGEINENNQIDKI
ncbi:MAG: ATP-binding cassette domain-containing protein [Butyrivibrio sp.]